MALSVPAPISAFDSLELEAARAARLANKTPFILGCAEIDTNMMGGGFGRGRVIGLSAETEEMELLFGLQTICKYLLNGISLAPDVPLPIDPPLADDYILVATTLPARNLTIRLCSVIKTFLPATTATGLMHALLRRVSIVQVFDLDGVLETLAAHGLDPQQQQQDHQDAHQQKQELPLVDPGFVLITHVTTLLAKLFATRAKSAAHAAITHFASYLRAICANDPLIMLLNSMTVTVQPVQPPANPATPQHPRRTTMRSLVSMHVDGVTEHRPKKPAYGQLFAQMLDVHVLCTRKEAGLWVAEVLLDEEGVWNDERTCWMSRETRWGLVKIEGPRIVDAVLEAQ